jgi:peptide/nickel transport system substrate-binding protein
MTGSGMNRFAGLAARIGAALIGLGGVTALPATAEPRHGIAMYGDPALPPDLVSLPYANPDAPKGGRLVLGESGSFDSMNPYILKGTAAAGLAALTVETLMIRSIDEPFTLYGLLAESVETDESRSWVAFTLRERAAFSDGTPVTVEDVIWSLQTLGTLGHPRYQTAWGKVAGVTATGPRSLRIDFNTPDRELALLMGLRPILKRQTYDGRAFDASSLDVPVGSGPYVVDAFEPGRFVSYRRNPDWWARDLPVMRGLFNFDEIRFDYYGDGDVTFQAFTAGETMSFRETNPAKWAAYDFPALAAGDVVKAEIPHQRPSGITGLVMNMRNPVFADWRVREAMILAFNFDFINQTVNGGADPRITSYFSNSPLGMDHGPATGKVGDLLQPFAADLLPGVIEGYSLPVGTADNALDRASLRKARALLEEAGWTVTDGGLADAAGKPFTFEILLASGATDSEKVVDIYRDALANLGIVPTVTVVDSAQYTERTNTYAFDMAWYTRALSLSPGNEQLLYWGARGVTEPGTRNWMGMEVPAAEAMVAAMTNATTQEDFVAATQALDRILTAGRYVIPVWYPKVARLAHVRQLHYPERLPLYGDWPGFQPDVWWYEE